MRRSASNQITQACQLNRTLAAWGEWCEQLYVRQQSRYNSSLGQASRRQRQRQQEQVTSKVAHFAHLARLLLWAPLDWSLDCYARSSTTADTSTQESSPATCPKQGSPTCNAVKPECSIAKTPNCGPASPPARALGAAWGGSGTKNRAFSARQWNNKASCCCKWLWLAW